MKNGKQDGRATPISQRAHEIYNEIKDLPHPFTKSYNTGEDTLKLAEALHNVMRGTALRRKVTVTIKPYVLYVGTKQKSREDHLTDMIRRLALQVDDEALYDEAMTLIGAYGGD